MKSCIYCQTEKEESVFSLEHIIPQFLGGAQAPDIYKTHNVCRQCNSNLGLFVDAGFEKNWLVSNHLRDAAYASFDPDQEIGLPLLCMADSKLTPPEMQEDEICESWIGPLGEQIFWVRPHDSRLYWYAGGNPRTTKTKKSRAYYLFSERTYLHPKTSWLAFRDSFEGRQVKKIMCTKVFGANPVDIGFAAVDELDELDKSRIDYFNAICRENPTRTNQISFYTQYDFRFLAKIALGVAYANFGEKALNTPYAQELYKALWYREGEDLPKIKGTPAFANKASDSFLDLIGEENAVTITLMPNSNAVALNLNIGKSLNWVVKCIDRVALPSEDLKSLGAGKVIILFRQLRRGVSLSLLEYLADKSGNQPHAELSEIRSKIGLHKDYFKDL